MFSLRMSTVQFSLSIQSNATLLFCFILSSQSFSISPQAVLASFVLGGATRIAKRYLEAVYAGLRVCYNSIFGLKEPLVCCWTKPLVLSIQSKFSFWHACLLVWSTLSFLILHTSSWHTSSSKLPGVWSKINSWTHKFPVLFRRR